MSGKPVRGNEKSRSYPSCIKKTQTKFNNNNINKHLTIAPNIIKIKNDNRPYRLQTNANRGWMDYQSVGLFMSENVLEIGEQSLKDKIQLFAIKSLVPGLLGIKKRE